MALPMSKEITITATKRRTSTVSKIVHQSYFQEFSVAKDHTTFTSQDASRLPTQRLDTKCALSEWFQDSHSAGIPITRAMIRKQAAIVAANAWKQNNQSNFDENVAEDQSRWNEDAQSSSSPSSKSMYSSLRLELVSHMKADQPKISGSAGDVPAGFPTTSVDSTDPSRFSYADTWNQQQAASCPWDPSLCLAATNYIPFWTGLGPVDNADHISTGIAACSPMRTGPARSSNLDASRIQSCSVYSDALLAIDTLHGHLAQTSEPTALDMFCLRHLQERLKGGAPLDG